MYNIPQKTELQKHIFVQNQQWHLSVKRRYFYISFEQWACFWFWGFFLLLIAFFFLVDWLVWCSGFSKLRSENHKKKKSSKSSKLLQISHAFNFVLSILKLSSTEWFRTLKEVVISLLKFFVHSNEEQHEVPNLLKESAQLLL